MKRNFIHRLLVVAKVAKTKSAKRLIEGKRQVNLFSPAGINTTLITSESTLRK
jgi:hypothetical protein